MLAAKADGEIETSKMRFIAAETPERLDALPIDEGVVGLMPSIEAQRRP
jgi:hypothetical protein